MSSDWRSTLSKNVKRMRTDSGMGLREFARYVRLSYQTYSRIEQGRGCSVDNLGTLKTALRVSWDELLDPVTCSHKWVTYIDDLLRCTECKTLGREVVYTQDDDVPEVVQEPTEGV